LIRSRESEEELSYWKVKKIGLERATDRKFQENGLGAEKYRLYRTK
jgi:hypothetical protein